MRRLRRDSSLTVFATLVAVAATIVVLWPILAYPIRADDQYWILTMPPRAEGSALLAYLQPFSSILGGDGTQLRSTAAAYGERRMAAVLVMAVATWLGAPPLVIWGVMKAAILLSALAALIFFLRVFRYWSRGESRALSSPVVLAISFYAPIIVLAAAEVRTHRLNNGWVYYPVLTYTPIIWYLGVGMLLIALERVGSLRTPLRTAGVIVAGGIVGAFLNFGYEVVALAVPLGCLILLAYAGKDRLFSSRWWQSKLMVLLPFGVVYTAVFAWIRWRLSTAECRLDDTCYEGTLVSVSGEAILNNFLAALPSSAPLEFVSAAAQGATSRSMLLSVAMATLVVLSASIALRGWQGAESSLLRSPDSRRSDITGLWWLIGISVAATVGITVITAITERAVERLVDPISPYRAGPTIWMFVAIAVAASFTILALALHSRVGSRGGTRRFAAVLTVLILGSTAFLIGAQQWQNINEYRLVSSSNASQALDRIHAEVARGDVSENGNSRRCQLLAEYSALVNLESSTVQEVLRGADRSFNLYHDQEFCSPTD